MGAFVIDGPTLTREAIAASAAGGAVTVDVVYAEATARLDVVEAAHRHGIKVVAVAEGALSKVTSPVTAQSMCALAQMPESVDLAGLDGLVLVLDRVSDPGNAGTLVRVSEATDAAAVLFCGDGVDPWNPKSVRASAGSAFRVPIGIERDTVDALERLRSDGFRILAAGGGGVALDTLDLAGDIAVVLGNEAHGVSDAVRDAADEVVAIPMAGKVESLNVAMAGTVIAFESARQRRVGS